MKNIVIVYYHCLHCFGECNFQTLYIPEIMTSGNKTKLLIYAECGTSSSCAIRDVLSELWYIFVSDCIHNPSGHFNVETTLFQ